MKKYETELVVYELENKIRWKLNYAVGYGLRQEPILHDLHSFV